jgi:hypothetical protein
MTFRQHPNNGGSYWLSRKENGFLVAVKSSLALLKPMGSSKRESLSTESLRPGERSRNESGRSKVGWESCKAWLTKASFTCNIRKVTKEPGGRQWVPGGTCQFLSEGKKNTGDLQDLDKPDFLPTSGRRRGKWTPFWVQRVLSWEKRSD